MKHLALMFFFMFVSSVFAQKQDVEIITSENENITTLVAKNNSDKKKFKINLALETQGYKVTPGPPYEVVVGPGDSVDIVKLVAKIGEPQSLGYKISYTTVGGQSSLAANIPEDKVQAQFANSAIVIFTKDTCTKCAYAKKKMNELGITFKELPLEDNENSELMWSALFNQGFDTNTIGTPVFAIKGKIKYNITDMDKFIKDLENM